MGARWLLAALSLAALVPGGGEARADLVGDRIFGKGSDTAGSFNLFNSSVSDPTPRSAVVTEEDVEFAYTSFLAVRADFAACSLDLEFLNLGSTATQHSDLDFRFTDLDYRGEIARVDVREDTFPVAPRVSFGADRIDVSVPGGIANTLPVGAVHRLELGVIAAPVGRNQLANPRFDADLSGWTPELDFLEARWDPADVGGSASSGSARLRNLATFSGTRGILQCVDVVPGASYRLSGWIQVPPGQVSQGWARLDGSWRASPSCAGFVSPLPVSPAVSSAQAGRWVLTQVEVTVPPGVHGALLGAFVSKTDAGGSLAALFDDLSLARLPTPERCNGRDDDCDGLADEDFADRDGDGVGDPCDNCLAVPNPGQEDLDAGADDDSSLPGVQHYGDACDADLDNDGIVGASDFFGVFRPCLGQPPLGSCAKADLDGDGVVGASDFFGVLRPRLGSAPGPGFSEP